MVLSGLGFSALLKPLAALNVATLFSGKRASTLPRTVFVNHPKLPPEYLDSKGRPRSENVFASNQIITSKYNLITFIPRDLLEQFRRVANLFFLAITIIQFVLGFLAVSQAVSILPLVCIVTGIALKDGYEDFKRHQADSRVNHSTVWVLTGGGWTNPNTTKAKSKTFTRGALVGGEPPKTKAEGNGRRHRLHSIQFDGGVEQDPSVYHNRTKRPHWKRNLWEDLHVGDIIKLEDNDFIPADVLICSTSEEGDVAYVETKNLDGETNLKSRRAVPALVHLRTADDCAHAEPFKINCDRPDTDLDRLHANVECDGERTVADISMALLRGSVVKNTSWVIAIVLFTGFDSKIMLNSGETPSKRSRVEKQMDLQVLINLAVLIITALVCAIIDSALEQYYYPSGAPWLYGDNTSQDNPYINVWITFSYAIFTLQDIIPISLYVSIEVVRTVQAASMYLDPNMLYQQTDTPADTPAIARSWNLAENLGQIEYIFSDKTGTLTQNLMVFRHCSIGGKVYRGTEPRTNETDETPARTPPLYTEPASAFDLTRLGESSTITTNGVAPAGLPQANASDITHFYDPGLREDLERAMTVDETSEFAAHARTLNGFFTTLALCHSVLTEYDPGTENISYKAQSPDEAALVQAAADVGFVFLGRENNILILRTPFSPEPEKYELLNILEFTSARKRMSVILRKVRDKRIFLLIKGADDVIFDRLRPEGDDMKALTDQHLRKFANKGLRTLTLAYKVIREDEYAAWSERYWNANTHIDDRESKVDAVCDEIERDLRVLGATAIEDRLQDGVPEAIADLKRAGIKIWVVTGDKLETAIAIGRSTNLIANDANIIIVRASPHRSVREQMSIALQRYFSDATGEVKAPGTPNVEEADVERCIPLQIIYTGVTDIVGVGNGERAGGFVLVIDGGALLEAFATEENKDIFLRLSTKCDGVICCRASSLQKVLVVKLVKGGLGAMTLAIGDGANDVSMIQAADVGVGIFGEGLQAVNSSDYAIAQFRFLTRLLFVHGHQCYARNGTVILNSFYKNIMAVGILFWWQIYNGWSGTYGFDYTYILFWNYLWTVLPVIGIGIFDRMADDQTLMELPELYRYGREGYWFNLKQFYIYTLDGIVQTILITFLILYTYGWTTTARQDGWNTFLYEFSTPMVFSAVLAANIFAGITSTTWTIWLALCILFGIVVSFTAIYSVTLLSSTFWLVLPITFALAMAPRLTAKSWKVMFMPDDIDIIRTLRKQNPHFDLSQTRRGLEKLKRPSMPTRAQSRSSTDVRLPQDTRSTSRTDMATGLVSEERGFNFSAEEGGVAMRRMQTQLSDHQIRRASHTRPLSAQKAKEALSQVFSLKRRRDKHGHEPSD